MYAYRRCLWHNGYHHWKWTWRPEFVMDEVVFFSHNVNKYPEEK